MLRKVCADEIRVAVKSRFMSVRIFEVSASNSPLTNFAEAASDEDSVELITSMIRGNAKSNCSCLTLPKENLIFGSLVSF